jgi:hypothetical protein
MHRAGCRREDHPRIGRRQLLQAGGLGLFGVSLADLIRLESHAAQPRATGPAKAVVFIFQSGGPSQHETFDPKPLAPDGIRGDYGAVQTRTPGLLVCEHLPRLAARSDKFAIVRTLHHRADRQFRNEHDSCHYLLHTGSVEMPAGDTNGTIRQPRAGRIEWPSIGALVAYAAPPAPEVGLPAVIELPRQKNMAYAGRSAGILGPRFERWGVDLAPPCKAPDPAGSCPNCFSHDDPNDPARAAGKGPNAWWDNSSCRDARFHLPQWGGPEIAVAGLTNRLALLEQLEGVRARIDGAAKRGLLASWDAHRQQALRILLATRPGGQNPFDLEHEPEQIRDLYGREEWGQGFLVARRLVQAGVRMVHVNLRGWDTHQNAFRDLKGRLLPSLDHCLSGFLDDLEARGLLDQTLIVMCGEMGRTPKISPIAAGGKNASGEVFTPGRHHWGDVFPCLLAGGGIPGGQVIGQTDSQGGQPAGDAYTPADLAATIFHQLGIDPEAHFYDAAGRPYRMFLGRPIL